MPAAIDDLIIHATVNLVEDSDGDGTFRLTQLQVTGEPSETSESADLLDAIPHAQPAGLHFLPYVDSEGVLLSVSNDADKAWLIVPTPPPDKRPPAVADQGTGGLYYNAKFKVMIKADGKLYMGDTADDIGTPHTVARADTLVPKYNAHVHPTPWGLSGLPNEQLVQSDHESPSLVID